MIKIKKYNNTDKSKKREKEKPCFVLMMFEQNNHLNNEKEIEI